MESTRATAVFKKCDDSLPMRHLTELHRVASNTADGAYDTLAMTLLPEDKRSLPPGSYANPPSADIVGIRETLAKDGFDVCRADDRLWAFKEDLALTNKCQPLMHSNFRELIGMRFNYREAVGFVNAADLGKEDWCYSDLSSGTLRVTNDPAKKEYAARKLKGARVGEYLSADKIAQATEIWTKVSEAEKESKPMSTAQLIGAFTLVNVISAAVTPVVLAYTFNQRAREYINRSVSRSARSVVDGVRDWMNRGGPTGGGRPSSGSRAMIAPPSAERGSGVGWQMSATIPAPYLAGGLIAAAAVMLLAPEAIPAAAAAACAAFVIANENDGGGSESAEQLGRLSI